MLPLLINLGFIKIYTFGVFLVLAFFWGSFLLWKNIALTSHKEEDIFDGLFSGLFGGLFIGRLMYISLNFQDFRFDILKYVLINGYPGVHMLGSVIGFFLFFYLFLRSRKILFARFIDYAVPALLLGLAIGKLGSFFSGAEVGAQTHFFVALMYPNLDGMRHLTPLYESILFFFGSFWSYRILLDIRRDKYSEGYNFAFFWLIYSFTMVVTDPIKSFQTMVYGVSLNLALNGIILLTVAIYVLYYFRTSLFKLFKGKRK